MLSLPASLNIPVVPLASICNLSNISLSFNIKSTFDKLSITIKFEYILGSLSNLIGGFSSIFIDKSILDIPKLLSIAVILTLYS